jgi:Xaa-Pro aminopeptidase
MPLWEKGLNYGHGTGHGIGTFLNVHEGPQAISYYRCIGVALEPGMITTIEPGYYKENEYGLRVENVALVVKDEKRSSHETPFFTFENLTLCPVDTRLVKKEILTQKEIEWLNDYHQKVYRTLAPLLDRTETAWLKETTKKI